MFKNKWTIPLEIYRIKRKDIDMLEIINNSEINNGRAEFQVLTKGIFS